MAKYAIRKLVRQADGTVSPIWVDAETGQKVQDTTGYELVTDLAGDSNFDPDTPEEEEKPVEESKEEDKEPPYEPSGRVMFGSVYDNDVIFDQPDVPIRQASKPSKSTLNTDKNKKAEPTSRPAPSAVSKVDAKPIRAPAIEEFPSVSSTPSKTGNIFKDYADKVAGAQGTVAKFDNTGLSPKAIDMVDRLNQRGYGDLGVNSGYRDPSKNKSVGGANKSQHIQGNAIDLATKNLPDQVKQDILDAALVGGARGVGIYPGGSMHVDVRENPAFWGPAGYAGSTVEEMPEWARDNLQALLDGQGAAYLSKHNVPTPIERPDPDAIDSEMSVAKSLTPAEFASWGYKDRTPEEKSMVSYALAGELSPKSLEGLMLGEPEAIQEAANILGAIENRSASKNLSIPEVLNPTQVNSMMEQNKGVTTNNYASYKDAIDGMVDGFYGGKLSDSLTAPRATHWANMDIVSPAWSSYANEGVRIGDHTFFSDVSLKDGSAVEYGLPEFSAYESKPMAEARSSINNTVENSWASEASKSLTSSAPDFGSSGSSSSSKNDYSAKGGLDSPSESVGRGLGESSRDSYSRDSINQTAESSWSSKAGESIASSAPDFSSKSSGSSSSKGSSSSSSNSKGNDYSGDYSAKGGLDSPGEGARGGLGSWI